MEKTIVISGTGSYAPPEVINNEELVKTFNAYVQQYNAQHATAIAAGQLSALAESSAEFIVKASGIQRRHVTDKKNILDVNIMKPQIAARGIDEISYQCEFALPAVKQALAAANKSPEDVDVVIVSCANTERAYPAIAIEVQQQLGIQGYGFDMQVACSSATFGLTMAKNLLKTGDARTVLLVTPEVATPQLNFRDRDSHFIFGDAAVAAVVETTATCQISHPFEIVSTKLLTQFSNNIRSYAGFMNRVDPIARAEEALLFTQQGRAVFKEVVPMAVKFIAEHLQAHQLEATDLKRLWLHQANINMNQLIAHKLLGREATLQEAPLILDEYGNTGSVGALLAFHLHHADIAAGEMGILCSFGAGYSIGSLLLRRL